MLILLGIVGLSYTASVRTQVGAMRATRGHVEALWAARAGVERARAELAAIDPADLTPDAPVFDDQKLFADQPVGPARYSLLVPPVAADGKATFGMLDEAARVNINTADETWIDRLPGITVEMRDCLLDWRDSDKNARPAGAESAWYEDLEAPYPARNGPLASLRELMRVRGWAPVWRQVHPDPYARLTGGAGLDRSPLNPAQAHALLGMLTVWSADTAKAPDGEAKMDLGSADANTMRGRISSLSEEEARSIEQWRGNGRNFQSAADLLDVERPREQNGGGNSRGGRGGGNNGGDQNGGQGGSGQKIFSLARVGEIIDYFKAGQSAQGDSGGGQPGRVNLNTAPREVLLTVPGIDPNLADAIIAQRGGQGLKGPGELAGMTGMDADTFRKVYPNVTTTSGPFHVWSRGVEPDSGASVTIEAVLAYAPKAGESPDGAASGAGSGPARGGGGDGTVGLLAGGSKAPDDGIQVLYWREE